MSVLRIVGSEAPPERPDDVIVALREALHAGELEFPLPGRGDTARRWSGLCEHGRRDLSSARLVEGHADAVAILHEAGDKPEPNALYGVWASRAYGRGAVLRGTGTNTVLTGTVPFCSGAGVLDRAVIAARPEGARDAADDVLVEIPLPDPRVRALPDTWNAGGMAASRTRDVELTDIPVGENERIGAPGFYTARPGFHLGGAGVAAVWLGGAVGVYDRVLDHLVRREPDEHQLAHLAAMHLGLVASDNTLAGAAADVDAPRTDPDPADIAAICRSTVERTACEVLALAPRVTGPGPLSRDATFARCLSDLEVYVRQHHGERDLAELGRQLVRDGGTGVRS